MRSYKHDINLSVFFPCYNEEQNIEQLVLETRNILKELVNRFEIIIIDDGSLDNTGVIAARLSQSYDNVRVVKHGCNRGYGAALISGFKSCIYEWIFFTDGDRQFYIRDIEKLLNESYHYNLIIGYRSNRQDALLRKIYAIVWNKLVKTLFKFKIKDVDCAFKLINKKLLDQIDLSSTGAVISTELLAKLFRCGVDIKEIEVRHKKRLFGRQTGGKLKVIIHALIELFKLYKQL